MSGTCEMNEPLQGEVIIEIRGNGSAEAEVLAKSESDRIKTFYQTVLSAIMVFILTALSGFKDMEPLHSTSTSDNKAHPSNLLAAEGLFIFMTFMCAVVLLMFEFAVYQKGQRGRGWYWVLTILVGITGMVLIVADSVLVILANRNNTVLSVILTPVVLLVGAAACAGAWLGEEHSSSSTLCSRYDAAMKANFDMATVGTIASFGLQGIVVFGYLKTPGSNQAKRDPPLDLAVCYVTSTVSLTVMMVCAMPLALLPDGMLEALIRAVEKLRHAMLAALGTMALVVSVEFLQGFVVLSVCPEAVAGVLYYAVFFFSERQPREGSSPHDFAFRMVVTVGFALMAGLYAAFLGSDHYSVWLKAAMFVLLLAVLSSLSRLAVPLHVPAMGGAVEIGIAAVALSFPAAALLSACPLVLKVLYDHFLGRF